MSDTPGPDPERDAWLREALRHAPDVGVTPPRSVSATILREAQAKAHAGVSAAAPGSAPAGGFAALWAWLARPQVAAGAASLMIASVAGVMWWDRPLDVDRGPSPRSVPATPTAAAPASAPAAAAAPAVPAVIQAPAISLPPRATPATTAAGPAAAQREAADTAARDNAGTAAVPPMRLQKSPGALAAASAAPADLAALRQAIAAEPQRWSWQRGAGSPQPADGRLRDWLAEADAAAAPRWRRAPPAPAQGESPRALAGHANAAAADDLRLLRDGRHVATLRLEGRTLRLDNVAAEDQPATARQAELDAARAEALHQSLP